MDVQKITHEVRLQRWERLVKECRNSGKPIKIWCDENRINIKTYYHWQKLVCQATCREISIVKEPKPPVIKDRVESVPVFAKLSIPASQTNKLAVAIQHNTTQINIYCGADIATVEAAIAAIQKLC